MTSDSAGVAVAGLDSVVPADLGFAPAADPVAADPVAADPFAVDLVADLVAVDLVADRPCSDHPCSDPDSFATASVQVRGYSEPHGQMGHSSATA